MGTCFSGELGSDGVKVELKGDFQSKRLCESIQKPKGLKHLGILPNQPSGTSTFTWRSGVEDRQHDFF